MDDNLSDGNTTIQVFVRVDNASTADNRYHGLSRSLTVTNVDNETAQSLLLSKTTALVSENGTTDNFTVMLTSQPSSNTVLQISSDNTSEVTVSPDNLTFTNSNWNTPQTVTLTGVDDNLSDGNTTIQVLVRVDNASTADNRYHGLSRSLTVTNVDNETAQSLLLSKTTALVSENGTTDNFTVMLTSQPSSNTVLQISSDNTSEVTVSPDNLTFTNSNWNTPQTVTLTGVDDNLSDGNTTIQVLVRVDNASTADNRYHGLSRSLTVTNVDNETAQSLSLSKTTALVSENGTTDNFTVMLTSQPSSNTVLQIRQHQRS